MKILIVGSDKIFAIENFYVRYLRNLGIKVYHFSAQSMFFDYYHSNVVNKLLFKAKLSPILANINSKFKEATEIFQPDFIWVFKGMEIFPDSLEWAKKRGIKLVNYNPDNPFLFSGTGSGNLNVKESIGLYDLHLTYSFSIKELIEDRFKIQSAILPFGYDVNEDLYGKCCNQNEVMKVCFLGNPDVHRAKFINELASSGVKIDVFGKSWKNFVKHKNIGIVNEVYGDLFWAALRRYRIQLNLMRPHNPDSHNMRSFEVPGVGGIQLAPNTADHNLYFEPGKEIFLYTDVDDCLNEINRLLSLTYTKASEIRINSRNRSISSGYSYFDRSRQALSIIKKI